ncbi:BrnT family toxin [Candidatus Albibeggiatoa sp. nov. BB20]|uniref:BrnT family toxin n=1 Tax=Candidatus Albibeggiatoa sp. nov. BB20 TaxID=3162723 RepID=UPI0033658960
MIDFEWDETKARSNKNKHDVSFFEATEVFSDEYAAYVRDPDHSHAEERYLVFGISVTEKYLVVSYTERYNIIRIISARHMTRQERKAYEQ